MSRVSIDSPPHHHDGISTVKELSQQTLLDAIYTTPFPFLFFASNSEEKRKSYETKPKVLRRDAERDESQYWNGTKKFFRVWFGGRAERERESWKRNKGTSCFIVVGHLVLIISQTGNSKGINGREDPFVSHHHNWVGGLTNNTTKMDRKQEEIS